MGSIPKICYFYWGGGIFSYLRYLTVYSFKKFNPDWKIRMYVPNVPSTIGHSWKTHEQKYSVKGKDYFSLLPKLGVEIIQFDFNKLGVSSETSEVFKSDILRWYLLSNEGGLWSDLDIIYFKSLDGILKEFESFDTLMCWHEYCSIGFLMAKPNNLIYGWARDTWRKNYNSNRYESVGCWLFMSQFKTFGRLVNCFNQSKILNISKSLVYPLDSNHVDQIYNGNNSHVFTEDTIGLHWYAGSKIAGDFQNQVNPETVNTLNNTLGVVIRRAIQ